MPIQEKLEFLDNLITQGDKGVVRYRTFKMRKTFITLFENAFNAKFDIQANYNSKSISLKNSSATGSIMTFLTSKDVIALASTNKFHANQKSKFFMQLLKQIGSTTENNELLQRAKELNLGNNKSIEMIVQNNKWLKNLPLTLKVTGGKDGAVSIELPDIYEMLKKASHNPLQLQNQEDKNTNNDNEEEKGSNLNQSLSHANTNVVLTKEVNKGTLGVSDFEEGKQGEKLQQSSLQQSQSTKKISIVQGQQSCRIL